MVELASASDGAQSLAKLDQNTMAAIIGHKVGANYRKQGGLAVAQARISASVSSNARTGRAFTQAGC